MIADESTFRRPRPSGDKDDDQTGLVVDEVGIPSLQSEISDHGPITTTKSTGHRWTACCTCCRWISKPVREEVISLVSMAWPVVNLS